MRRVCKTIPVKVGYVNALPGLYAHLKLAKLLVIVRGDTPLSRLAVLTKDALNGGADLLGVSPATATAEQFTDAYRLVHEEASPNVPVIVFDEPTVAMKVKADGLVLGSTLPSASRPHEWSLMGRGVTTEQAFREALADDGVHFIMIGPVFRRDAKDECELVKEAARLAPPNDPASKPWFAVGGIAPDKVDRVMKAGAKRIAVSKGVTLAADHHEAVKQMRAALIRAWDDDPGMEKIVFGAL